MKIVLLVTLLVVCLRMRAVQTACSVSMNGGLPDPQPLILTPGGSQDVFGFKLPTTDGILSFAPSEKIRLVCPGSTNYFKNLGKSHKEIRVQCNSSSSFIFNNTVNNFTFFSCSETVQSTTKTTTLFCNNNSNTRIIEIGFNISTKFYKIIEVCFDVKNMNAIWSKTGVVSVIRGREVGFKSTGRNFTSGDFYPNLDMENLYRRETVGYNIGQIMTKPQADHYLTSTHYLTKGLLSASRNFLYNTQKNASLHFINTAPQWHSFMWGPWGLVEKHVRDYAHKNGVNLIVYTGTHGVTTLTYHSTVQEERQLYLSKNNDKLQIAVPAIYWKVVYEPLSKRGVVLVGVNNPYKDRSVLELDKATYRVCERLRLVSTWYICGAVAENGGFGYCCEVDDFRNNVTSLPPFEVTDILT